MAANSTRGLFKAVVFFPYTYSTQVRYGKKRQIITSSIETHTHTRALPSAHAYVHKQLPRPPIPPKKTPTPCLSRVEKMVVLSTFFVQNIGVIPSLRTSKLWQKDHHAMVFDMSKEK